MQSASDLSNEAERYPLVKIYMQLVYMYKHHTFTKSCMYIFQYVEILIFNFFFFFFFFLFLFLFFGSNSFHLNSSLTMPFVG